MGERNQFTLKELRARKDKTQEQVASDLGISVGTYNGWEKKGIYNVKASRVIALARYYGVPLSDIFFGPQHEYNSCEIQNTGK